LSGKTTNLEYIYGSIPGTHRGKMVSMKTKTERTLFFDFLPVQLGELSGFKTRFLLYTVPGQVYYNATRKLVLKGVDAVVFVADSKRGKMDENVESLQNLRENLLEHGLKLEDIPFVLQYNKRDLPEVYSISELDQVLNPMLVPTYEAVATSGPGVVETFKAVSKLLLKKLAGEIGVPIVGSGKGEGIELSAPAAPANHTPIIAQAPSSGAPAPSGGSSAPHGGSPTNVTPGGQPNSGAWAQQSPPTGRGAWAQQAGSSAGAADVRVEHHSVLPEPVPSAPASKEPRSQGGFTGSLGSPVHGPAHGFPHEMASGSGHGSAHVSGSGSGDGLARGAHEPIQDEPVAPAAPTRTPAEVPARHDTAGQPDWTPGTRHTVGVPGDTGPRVRREESETDDSRGSGVAARLRRWLKREDPLDSPNAEPSSGAATWQTHASRSSEAQWEGDFTETGQPAQASAAHAAPTSAPLTHAGHPTPSIPVTHAGHPTPSAPVTHAGHPTPSAPATHAGYPTPSAPATAPPSARSQEAATHAGGSREGARTPEEGPFSDRSSERMSDRHAERLAGMHDSRHRSPAREVVVPVELTARDLEHGIVIRLAVRLSDDLEEPEDSRHAA
jgi:signal recognition particle receptor subunit beta